MNTVHKRLSVLFVIIMFLTSTVFANTLDDLEDQRDDLEDSIEENEQLLEENARMFEEGMARISELENQQAEVRIRIDELTNDVFEKEVEIKNTGKELELAFEEEAFYYEQMKKRIKVMYEYGETGYLEVLFESESLIDFFSRLEYLTMIFEYDDNMLENLEAIQNEIQAKETQLEIEQDDLEQLQAEAIVQKNELDNLILDKAKELELIESHQETLNALLEQQEKELEETEKAILKKIEEGKIQFADGEFTWPTPKGYQRITSYYGYRTHPVFGTVKYHNGIDIAVPYKTEIYAAEDGIVVFAGWMNGYGNLVIINHGVNNGSQYLTYYGHNAELKVQVDQAVTDGMLIALADSTGYSTGNHLHFGVKKDDEWVDPLNYFEKVN